MIEITTRSPEVGWQPLMDWIRAAGFDPDDIRSVVVDEEAMRATFELIRRTNGRPQVADGELVTWTTTVPIRELPPRRGDHH